MSKRLAITIAGAVSLGSYEAGVLYEILDALHQHNLDPLTPESEQIHIDVLTGASAGGMTAIILAQKILFSADQFVGPYDNPVYNVWVKRIDLSGLQQTKADEPALHSLFSSDLIEQISQEMLLSRYTNGPKPAAQRHAAAAEKIQVGVALTNLNGVDYGYPVKGFPVEPDSKFIYTRFTDQMTRMVDPAGNPACDEKSFWEPLRQAAVACGAFPIAFRPQAVARSAAAEPFDYAADNLIPWTADPRTFTYTDGGVLQNQPIGIAKNLVDVVDGHEDQENRFYLFVSPHAKFGDSNSTFTAANADYISLISRLAKVVMGQAGFQDWITAQAMNDRIDKLDERAKGLAEAIVDNELDVDCLRTAADSLLKLLFPEGQHNPPGSTAPETLTSAQDRIANQYKEEMADLASAFGPASPEALAFRDAVLTFESAAGLGARDTMQIYGITANESELAGAAVQAFLGFFDQTFRDHDYDIGRTHAKEFLKSALAGGVLAADGELGPIRYDPTLNPVRSIDTGLNGQRFGNIPVADKNEFNAGARARVKQMLKELLGPWALPADLALDALLDPVLDRVLAKL
jgi:predicted acylesterase/phospholipase RssA